MTSNDIARCAGIGNDDEGWREGCEDCARRTMPAVPDVSWWIMPPPIIAFECELRIEMPNAKLTSGAAAESETKR
ncbi:MAG TPA: hypothetical protein VIY48_16925 [Candidatus Paceibacterota bacterium]